MYDNFFTGKEHKAYEYLGCHPHNGGDSWDFAVWAPNAVSVSVSGDFNGWDPCKTPMTNTGGIWRAGSVRASRGDNYKYAVTGQGGTTRLKADPFALHSETGPATASRVWSIDGFEWTDAGYLARRESANSLKRPVSVYELHLGSWRKPPGALYPNYRQLADELSEYCSYMGYTHVELLPITEYPYGGSWGYQVTGYFAPTSRYGTPQDFMYFVDRLHSRNIGVIIDWVPAHFSRDAHGLSFFDGTPLFERADALMANHPQWGTLIFDYAKPEVRSFLISSAMSFFDRFHVDGIRADAVSSMVFLDYGRKGGLFTPNSEGGNICYEAVSLLRELNAAVGVAFPGCITIAEESDNYPGVTHPDGLGFTYKWDMGFMHDTLDYLSLPHNCRSSAHRKLTFSMMYCFSERHMLAFSHDEAVHGKKSMLDKMHGRYEEKFALLRAFFGFVFAHPGKKHIFMGAEFGQFIEWDFDRQLDWFLLDYPMHSKLREYVRILNKFYKHQDALYSIDDSWAGFRWLNADESELCCTAFMRTGVSGTHIICACNFSDSDANLTAGLPAAGKLIPVLNSDSVRFGGNGKVGVGKVVSAPACFREYSHSAVLRLPALSCIYYFFKTTEAENE